VHHLLPDKSKPDYQEVTGATMTGKGVPGCFLVFLLATRTDFTQRKIAYDVFMTQILQILPMILCEFRAQNFQQHNKFVIIAQRQGGEDGVGHIGLSQQPTMKLTTLIHTLILKISA
jgi:hypothetical protein